MMLGYLLPVPFLLVAIIALLWPRDRNHEQQQKESQQKEKNHNDDENNYNENVNSHNENANSARNIGYFGVAAGIITLIMLWQAYATGVSESAITSAPSIASAQSMSATSATWFSVAGTTLSWSIVLDQLSTLLVGIVAGIGIFVFLYSVGYLDIGEDLQRYYAELSLFAAAMIGAVTAGNLVQLFFCWELVGVSSYLLIGFWHDRESAIAAARKAFITIIIGDAFLLAGIFLLWHTYATFDITTILANAHPDTATLFAGVCIIVGAISKSAQFPLHTWLPDAMEGPTPVSAFLHSATMVKAGLYLVARFLPLLLLVGLSPLIIGIATITILLSACIALVEKDIKRVLAYSTMNQLGFILLALGIGASGAALLHLLNHSIFKALLFFSAGAIIHFAGTQDLEKMTLKFGWNLLAITTLLGVLSLASIPPLSGSFSKDAIMESVFLTGNTTFILFMCVAVFLSSLYIFRWYFLIFRADGAEAHTPWQMRIPLPLLATFTLFGGIISAPFIAWIGTGITGSAANGSIITETANSMQRNLSFISAPSIVSLLLALSGFICAYLIFYRKSWNIDKVSSSLVAKLFRAKFFVDEFYDLLANAICDIGIIFSWIDDHIINRFLDGITHFFTSGGALLRQLIRGRVSSYAFAILLGFITLLVILRFA